MSREPSDDSRSAHWRRLERLYHGAPINEYFRPQMRVRAGEADVRMVVRPDFFHAANAMHGSVYFKLLDDAAFFAVASLVEDVFVLTATMTVTFTKPVSGGVLTASGRVTGQEGHRFTAEASIVDEGGSGVGHGTGIFVRSRIPLASLHGFADEIVPHR